MKRISAKWMMYAVLGATIGVVITVWFWSKTSEALLTPFAARVTPEQAFTMEDRLNMMEAAYRHMFAAASSSIPARAICFLGVGAADDPPPELIDRMRNLPRPVEPISSGIDRVNAAKQTAILGPSFIVQRAQMVATNEANLAALTQRAGETRKHSLVVRRSGSTWTVAEQAPR